MGLYEYVNDGSGELVWIGSTVADELPPPCFDEFGSGYTKAEEELAMVGVAFVGFLCLVFFVVVVELGVRVIGAVAVSEGVL